MILRDTIGRMLRRGSLRAGLYLTGLALLGFLPFAGAARAATADDTMQVSVQVLASCILQGATLDFGEYIGQERLAATQIQVKCQPKVPYNVAMNKGQNYDGTYRGIAAGAHRLTYVLMQPNGHEWGDSDFANTYHWAASAFGIATGAWQGLTVSGTLFGGVVVPAGVYTDTVLVSVHF